MSLDTQLSFFRKHQKELAAEHHGEFALIHNETLVGFHNSELDAYNAAKKSKCAAGTFLIRQCVAPEEETTQVFHSRVAI